MHNRWVLGALIGSALLAACQTAGATSAGSPAAAPAAQTVRELKVGDAAPDFTLQDQNRENVRLSQFRGRPVQVAFYVWAFSPG